MAFAHVNGTELFHLDVGRGVPCIIMHGGLGVDHSQFREELDPLGDVLRLVYYDHRGNGRSGRPPMETLTLEQLAADADALRTHLGVERVAVLGHSYGGCVAQQYALQFARGQKLVAAVLGFHTFDPERVERLFSSTVWSAAACARSRELMADCNVVSRLGEIEVPTLILVGRHDFFCPPSQAERMHRGIRGSEMVVFERSGHYPFVEEAEAFRDAVRTRQNQDERAQQPSADARASRSPPCFTRLDEPRFVVR